MGRAGSVAASAKWRDLVDRWQRSGLSVAEFCRQQQISQPSFFSWRKRLVSRRTTTSQRRPQRVDRELPSGRFLQLPPSAWPAASGIQISLPGGAMVTLPPQAAAELVTTAIRAAMLGGTTEDRPC
jgi:hypothetical protein